MSTSSQEASGAVAAECRAAGTDLSERRRSGVSRGPVADLAPSAEMTEVAWNEEGGARIGASVTIAAIGPDPRIAAAYPGLAAAANGLATPQIRHVATLGGNLAQRSRCWYYRNPDIACLKKGGTDCPARDGQSPLRRRLRPRALRGRASLDDGRGADGLRGYGDDRPARDS